MISLRAAVDHWWMNFEPPLYLEELSREEWGMLQAYVDSTEPFLIASTMLAGENFCTGSSVIPCLDEINSKLKELEMKSQDGPTKIYIKNLLKFLSSDVALKRFKDLYKSTAPYNALTALDPRCINLIPSSSSNSCNSGIMISISMKHSTRTLRM